MTSNQRKRTAENRTIEVLNHSIDSTSLNGPPASKRCPNPGNSCKRSSGQRSLAARFTCPPTMAMARPKARKQKSNAAGRTKTCPSWANRSVLQVPSLGGAARSKRWRQESACAGQLERRATWRCQSSATRSSRSGGARWCHASGRGPRELQARGSHWPTTTMRRRLIWLRSSQLAADKRKSQILMLPCEN